MGLTNTLGSPWIPLVIRLWSITISYHRVYGLRSMVSNVSGFGQLQGLIQAESVSLFTNFTLSDSELNLSREPSKYRRPHCGRPVACWLGWGRPPDFFMKLVVEEIFKRLFFKGLLFALQLVTHRCGRGTSGGVFVRAGVAVFVAITCPRIPDAFSVTTIKFARWTT
jgi:hypothetical protein